MLTVSNVTKAYAGRTLFAGASLQVNRGDRVAIVGANGAGKSTLFSVILKEASPDEGTVSMEKSARLGFLPQETAPAGDETVLDLAISVDAEMEAVRTAMRSPDPTVRDEADGQFAILDGYSLEPKAKRILKGLAFRDADFERPLKTLSGGWVMRAHLARLLVMEPDLLMLDEPTNHLDLESLVWFQNHLTSFPGAILMISHDREFLNALSNTIIEIRNQKLNRYRGNYDDYLLERDARETQHLAAYKNQQKEIETLQRFADRFRAKASKASQAQSKLKQIDRMDKIDAPENSGPTISMRFPQPPRSGQRVITLKDIHQSYGELVVYSGIDFEAERGDRTVLVGPNGAGKSTLLKLLGGTLPPKSGERILGHNVEVGYFAQNRAEMLQPKRTVLEEAMAIEEPVAEQSARTILGSFLFRGDDVFKPVGVLSGGEKSRLALVKLLLDPPNLLLMDEPTTHLDMPSIDALIGALKQFEGTLIFISHDVFFIRSLAQKVLHIHSGQLTPYAGGYDYYLDKSRATGERAGLTAGGGLSDSRPTDQANDGSAPKVSIFRSKEDKKREATARHERARVRREAETAVRKIEEEILALETRRDNITAELEKPDAYESGGNAMNLNRELLAVQSTLEQANNRWSVAAEKLEALQNSAPVS